MKILYALNVSVFIITGSSKLMAQKIENEYNQLKETYDSKEFNYVVKELEPTEQIEPNEILIKVYEFLNALDWKMVLYIVIGLMVLFVLYTLYKRGLFIRYRSQTNNESVDNFDFIEDNLLEIDLNQPIQQAIASKNYPLAIRYYHYQNTQNLARKGYLVWDKKKTNRQLAFQINKEAIRELYLNNTSIFNHVWFGNFNLEEENFRTFEANFKFLNQSL